MQTNTGWICPRCDRVNAPTERQCGCTVQRIVYQPLPQPWWPGLVRPYEWRPFEYRWEVTCETVTSAPAEVVDVVY